jgi:hypothetical protein
MAAAQSTGFGGPTRYDAAVSRALLVLTLLLVLSPMAWAADLEVELGWGGGIRQDRWNVAHATFSHEADAARADIEWYVPRPGREAMVLRQAVTVQRRPTTVAALLPIGPHPRVIHARLIDEDGRTLAAWPEEQRTAVEVEPSVMVGLVGIAGDAPVPDDVRNLRLPWERLPRHPLGYDALDRLVLPRLDVGRLDYQQQQAIAAWVRGGGVMVMWLGPETLPEAEASPLVQMLANFLPIERGVTSEGASVVKLAGEPAESAVTSIDIGGGRIDFLHVDPTQVPVRLPVEETVAATHPPVPAGVPSQENPIKASWLLVLLLVGPVDALLVRRGRSNVTRLLTYVTSGTFVIALLLAFGDLGDDGWIAEVNVAEEAGVEYATAAVLRRRIGTTSEEDALMPITPPVYWRLAADVDQEGDWREVPALLLPDGIVAPVIGHGVVVEATRYQSSSAAMPAAAESQ